MNDSRRAAAHRIGAVPARRVPPGRALAGVLAVGLVCASLGGGTSPVRAHGDAVPQPETTYERYLPRAVDGDPEVQNFLGYMLFFGEGLARDVDESHYWFHQAAEQGHRGAQRNLAVLHGGSVPGVPARLQDIEESLLWLQRSAAGERVERVADMAGSELDRGRDVFETYCAICHGIDGNAVYADVPSFARGERLERSDGELMRSVVNGSARMPAWGATLPAESLSAALVYLRRAFASDSRAPGSTRGGALPAGEDTPLERGEQYYVTFCSGCHGFNGISFFVHSPSFALGQGLAKSDAELHASILRGVGSMPGWENKLEPRDIDDLVAFIRTLESSYRRGIATALRRPPERWFRFRRVPHPGSFPGN